MKRLLTAFFLILISASPALSQALYSSVTDVLRSVHSGQYYLGDECFVIVYQNAFVEPYSGKNLIAVYYKWCQTRTATTCHEVARVIHDNGMGYLDHGTGYRDANGNTRSVSSNPSKSSDNAKLTVGSISGVASIYEGYNTADAYFVDLLRYYNGKTPYDVNAILSQDSDGGGVPDWNEVFDDTNHGDWRDDKTCECDACCVCRCTCGNWNGPSCGGSPSDCRCHEEDEELPEKEDWFQEEAISGMFDEVMAKLKEKFGLDFFDNFSYMQGTSLPPVVFDFIMPSFMWGGDSLAFHYEFDVNAAANHPFVQVMRRVFLIFILLVLIRSILVTLRQY